MLPLVEGWNSKILYQLQVNNQAIDMVNNTYTATFLLYDNADNLVTPTGTSGTSTASTGVVHFHPVAGDLQEALSPYKVRWRVTTAGESVYFPQGEPEIWKIYKP